MEDFVGLKSIDIRGYRVFGEFHAEFTPLTVIVGANGCGKSCLIEFLSFLRDSVYQDIPPEISAGSQGREVLHNPPDSKHAVNEIHWDLAVSAGLHKGSYQYKGSLTKRFGTPFVEDEILRFTAFADDVGRMLFHRDYLDIVEEDQLDQWFEPKEPVVWFDFEADPAAKGMGVDICGNQLGLREASSGTSTAAHWFREYVRSWRFYSSFDLDSRIMSDASMVEQNPRLKEDGSNLSAVLHYLATEQEDILRELQDHVRLVVPGFTRLIAKARGGPGEVLGYVTEGIDNDFSLKDLSDGILRLIVWALICLHPSPPSLVCIDEPELGLHPRVLPLLAGLIESLSTRTQVIVTTHSSYFLRQFDLDDIAVMRKEEGEARFLRPKDSKVLQNMLREFGSEEIELLHQSDELESI